MEASEKRQEYAATSRSSANTRNIASATSVSAKPEQPVHIPDIPGLDEKTQQEQCLVSAEAAYRETSSALSSEDVLGKFLQEYERLYRSLWRSAANGKRAFDQFGQLHIQYHENVHSNKLLQTSTSNDEHFIKNMRNQIKRANDFLEASKLKEEKAKDEQRRLRIEVNDLKVTLQQGVGLSSSQERNINDLMRAKDDATKELEKEMGEIAHLRAQLSNTVEKIHEGDVERRLLDQEIFTLKDENAKRKLNVDADLRNKERLEQELRDSRAAVSIKMQDIRQKQDIAQRILGDTSMLESQIKTQRQLLEKLTKEHAALNIKLHHYRQECDEIAASSASLLERRVNIQHEFQKKEIDLHKIQSDLEKALKLREAIAKKLRQMETKRAESESERRRLRTEMESTLVETERIRHDIETDKKLMEDLVREKTIISQSYKKLMSEAEREHHMSVIYAQSRRTLEMELDHYQREIGDLTKVYAAVEVERDNYVRESQSLQEQAVQATAAMKQKEVAIFKHKRQMAEADTKLKHQQNLYDGVQSDRNLHAKHLVDNQGQIIEMKRHLKIMNFQINGYKEEIRQKSEFVTRELQDFARLGNEKQAIEEETKTLKQQNELALAYARSQIAEESKLGQYLKEAEAERMRQEHALSMVVSERDQLSAQLMKLESELSQLYDKIKTQQFALNRSQKHYFEKLKEYRQLKREISDTRRTKAILDANTANAGLISTLVHQLQADLLHENAQVKYLEEEIKNPINIHRWRKLEGSDPKSLELIQLVQSLQRKLITKSKEDKDKEALIQSRECVYLQLKNIAGKQVGPEILEQVSEMEKVLKSKNDKLRRMSIELDMYNTQMKEAQYAIHTLDRQLGDLKSVYFDARRKADKQRSSVLTPVLLDKHDKSLLDSVPTTPTIEISILANEADIAISNQSEQDQPIDYSSSEDNAPVLKPLNDVVEESEPSLTTSPPLSLSMNSVAIDKPDEALVEQDLPLLP